MPHDAYLVRSVCVCVRCLSVAVIAVTDPRLLYGIVSHSALGQCDEPGAGGGQFRGGQSDAAHAGSWSRYCRLAVYVYVYGKCQLPSLAFAQPVSLLIDLVGSKKPDEIVLLSGMRMRDEMRWGGVGQARSRRMHTCIHAYMHTIVCKCILVPGRA